MSVSRKSAIFEQSTFCYAVLTKARRTSTATWIWRCSFMALKYHLQSIDNVPKAYTDNDSEDSGSDVFDNLPGTDLEDSSAPFSDVCSETWPNTGCDFSSLIDSHIAMCDSLFQSHGEKNVGTAAAIEIMAGTSKVSLTRSDTDKPLSGQIVDCLLDPYDIFRPSGRVFIKPSWPENPKVTGKCFGCTIVCGKQ